MAIVYRFPRLIWSVNQFELFSFFTDLGILTSAPINLVFIKELLIVQCEVRNHQSSRKRCVPQDSRSCPWQKYWKPLYVLFLPLSIENTSTWLLVRSVQLFKQKRWSRGRFNRFSTVACKGPFCVEVLSSFYGRFFVEEGQFINSTSSLLCLIFFLSVDAASLWRAESWKRVFRKSNSLPETVSAWSS